ncbi:hypothetical protein DUNSADRAFT_985 [Dunaliella salina]|uniref:Encoded protein n=1 Tax=Dunaliella salina TaxID=3046 RepID=A0ABQ7FY83_DUNSA|nr:hypothetical protein DUNSADRAFT_985 [Dunaliella salina]|eukprot:KAF5827292.1 hypothetical protein DUNSADRAFT_985 [Dunaliella salina]
MPCPALPYSRPARTPTSLGSSARRCFPITHTCPLPSTPMWQTQPLLRCCTARWLVSISFIIVLIAARAAGCTIVAACAAHVFSHAPTCVPAVASALRLMPARHAVGMQPALPAVAALTTAALPLPRHGAALLRSSASAKDICASTGCRVAHGHGARLPPTLHFGPALSVLCNPACTAQAFFDSCWHSTLCSPAFTAQALFARCWHCTCAHAMALQQHGRCAVVQASTAGKAEVPEAGQALQECGHTPAARIVICKASRTRGVGERG